MAPIATKLLYVSVMDSNTIRVVWQKSTIPYFGTYTLVRDSVPYVAYSRNDTVYTDSVIGASMINANLRSYCYSLSTSSDCGKSSLDPQVHCSIWLTAKALNGISVQLNWTPYSGWYDLAGYKIYRSIDGGQYSYLADVNAGTNSYVDGDLCAHNYCYRIDANRASASYIASSNTACARPPYVFQTNALYLNSATVDNGNQVQVFWQKTIQLNPSEYIVDRFDPQFGWNYGYVNTTDTTITDARVNVNIENYIYRVRDADKCGNTSPLSNIGKTILLGDFIKDDKIALYWNNYAQWPNGIKNSLVQRKYHQKDFSTVASVPGTDTSFIYNDILPQSDTDYCFRIISFANGTGDSSVSNISCAVLPSRVFVANAFTPNNDGLNDSWSPSTLFINDYVDKINSYSIKIFDRWGEKVFESDKITDSWDGTRDGSKAPAGVYIYILKAQGLDGKSFYFKGNITLLR